MREGKKQRVPVSDSPLDTRLAGFMPRSLTLSLEPNVSSVLCMCSKEAEAKGSRIEYELSPLPMHEMNSAGHGYALEVPRSEFLDPYFENAEILADLFSDRTASLQ